MKSFDGQRVQLFVEGMRCEVLTVQLELNETSRAVVSRDGQRARAYTPATHGRLMLEANVSEEVARQFVNEWSDSFAADGGVKVTLDAGRRAVARQEDYEKRISQLTATVESLRALLAQRTVAVNPDLLDDLPEDEDAA